MKVMKNSDLYDQKSYKQFHLLSCILSHYQLSGILFSFSLFFIKSSPKRYLFITIAYDK
jgi:hypothetical protein